jgi:hypothetical protein
MGENPPFDGGHGRNYGWCIASVVALGRVTEITKYYYIVTECNAEKLWLSTAT